MKRPEPWELVFALKTFGAGMLALYLALRLDLPRPYWALVTAYVVSQSFASASLSKGLFRFGGTIVGATAGVTINALFASSDWVVMVGVVAWVGFCGYFARLDRSPRSYFFVLAGVTAAVVGWPGPGANTVFDTAVARSEEIGVGMLCAVLVHTIIFPRPIEPVIKASLLNWSAEARRLAVDSLRGTRLRAHRERRKLAADAGQIGTLAVHLHYDSLENQQMARWIDVLQQCMLMLLPILASIEDRVDEFRRSGSPTADLDPVLEQVALWIDAGAPREGMAALVEAISAIEPKASAGSDWQTVQLIGIAGRLRDLVEAIGDVRDLREHIFDASQPASPRLQDLAQHTMASPHRDPGLALWAVAGGVVAVGTAAMFWYLTGWTQGSTATQIALIMSFFFAAFDDPTPILRKLVMVLVVAIFLDGIYLLVILPRIEDFWVLVLAFAPVLIPLALLIVNPQTLVIGLMPVAFLSISEMATTDTAAFLNGMAAIIGGAITALVASSVVRTIGADLGARRILRAGWRELEAIAAARDAGGRDAFASRMLDRLGLLAPRLDALPANDEIRATDALSDLRLGLNLFDLQHYRPALEGAAAHGVDNLLRDLRGYFHRLGKRGIMPPPGAVLEQLDSTVTAVLEADGLRDQRAVLLTLGGIRESLFPDAAPYTPRTGAGHGPASAGRLAAAQ